MKLNRLMKSRRRTIPESRGAGSGTSLRWSDAGPFEITVEALENMLLMSASADVTENVDNAVAESSTDFSGADEFLNEVLSGNFNLPAAIANDDLGEIQTLNLPSSFADTMTLSREIVFVDTATPEYELLVHELLMQHGDREFEVILLRDDQSGIEQITTALSQRENVAAMHIISHGSSGTIQLGNENLSESSVIDWLPSIGLWSSAFTEDADILLYGCDLAANESGQSLLRLISETCGCDVAASVDTTGHVDLGGDWDLEYQLGDVETLVPFSEYIEDEWFHTLPNNPPTDIYAVPNVPDSNVLGYYSFNSTGDMGQDDAGDVSPITFTGSPGVTAGPGGDAALDLAGGASNQFGEIAGITTGGEMTVAGWVRFDSTGQWERVIDFGQTNSGGIGNIIVSRVFNTNDLRFTYEKQGLFTNSAVAAGAIANGTWLHFAGTIDSTGNMALYVNGVLADTFAGVTPDIGVRSNNFIGASHHAVDSLLDGAIDDLVVVNAAMDAASVAALYQQSNVFAVAENSATGTLVGTVFASDPDTADTRTFSLVDDAGGRFIIDSATGQISVANGSLLDFEAAASHSVTIRVTDQGALSYDEVFTINLTNTGDAATISNLAGDRVDYAAGAGAILIDQGGDAFVADIDSANFATGNLTVAIASGGNSTEDVLSIRNQGNGAGQIGVSGANVSYGGVQFGTVTGGSGGSDLVINLNANASAAATTALVRNITFLNTNASSPAVGSREIRFTIDDGDGVNSLEYDATVNLAGTSHATILDRFGTGSYSNNDGTQNWSTSWQELGESNGAWTGFVEVDSWNNALAIGSSSTLLLFSTDITGYGAQRTADLSNAISASLSLDVWKAGVGSGSVTLAVSTNGSTWTNLQTFNFGSLSTSRTSYTFDISAFSSATTSVRLLGSGTVGGLLTSGYYYTDNIEISYAYNTAPIIALPGAAVNYVENTPATIIDSTATITDVDSADFAGGQLTVDFAAGGSASDRLAIRNQGTGAGQIGISGSNVTYGGVVIGSFVGGTDGSTPLVLSLNANATANNVEAAIRNVTYQNVSDAPSTAARQVRFQVTDGDGGTSTAVSETILVTATNDAPTLSSFASIVDTTNEDTEVAITFADLATQGDETDIDGSVSSFVVKNVASGTLKLGTSSATATAWASGTNDTIDGVINAYWIASADANGTLNAFDVVAKDVGGLESVGSVGVQIDVLPINDAPVMDLDANNSSGAVANDFAVTFIEQNGAVAIVDSDAVLTDVDTANLTQITATLTNDLEPGNAESLQADTTGTSLIAVWDTNTNTLTVSGPGTVADYLTVLRTVSYNNLSNNPNPTVRVVTFIANDGAVDSVIATSRISFSTVNDAPTISAIGNVAVNEDTSTGSLTFSINDAETPSAALTVTATSSNQSLVPDSNIVLGGSGILRTISVLPAANQFGGPVTITVTVNDGATSTFTTFQVTVSPVNDSPFGIPSILGIVQEDQILTADTSGLSDADGLGAFSYQWTRNGLSIAGATNLTYTTGDLDVNAILRVQVSYVDGNGTPESILSSATAAVANVNDLPVGQPVVVGIATEDQTLVADVTALTDADGLGVFNYQWLRNGSVIVGATNGTYTLSDPDVATQISVQVSYADGHGTNEVLTSAVTALVSNVNDAPVGQPAVLGTASENQNLTAEMSGVSDLDGLGPFAYQWLRNGFAIAGATNSTYTATNADVGSQISVRTIYTDAYGTVETLTSGLTAVVTNVNDTPVGLPLILGTATEDQTLTVDASGISDVDGLGSFSFQWRRNGVAISGATAASYVLSDADVASQITVDVIYVDGHGTTELVSSAATAAVVNVNDTPGGIPIIVGSAIEDQTLSVDVSSITDADGVGLLNYQWLRDGIQISGATGNSYVLGDNDVNSQLSVHVTYIDGNGTSEFLASASTGSVTNVNDVPTGAPIINGVATEGQTLSADISAVGDADGVGTISYQWLRDGVAISGATNSSVLLSNADVASQISLQVSYTDGNGAFETLTSAVTSAIANVNDAATGLPVIVGTAVENQTLSIDVSGISDADGLGFFSYQWLRNGVAIFGATNNSYTLGDADVGTQIQAQVRYVDGHGTLETPTSTVTSAVVNVNDIPVGIPAIIGSPTEDQTLTADISGISDADGLGVMSYQWYRDGAAISGATGNTFTLGDADVASRISVQVSYTDSNGTLEVLQSSATTPVTNVNDAPIGLPSIGGTVVEDQTLTADVSGIFDADGLGALQYQWFRDGVAISGASNAFVTLGDADVGAQIQVQVSYVDGQGMLETITSASTSTVVNVNDAPSVSSIADQTFSKFDGSGVLTFALNDIDNSVNTLTIQAFSSDTTVVPLTSVLLGGSGGSRTIQIIPDSASNFGTSIITIVVNDGLSTTSLSFTVSTLSGADKGVIYEGATTPTSGTGSSGSQTSGSSGSSSTGNDNSSDSDDADDPVAILKAISSSHEMEHHLTTGSKDDLNGSASVAGIEQALAALRRDNVKIALQDSSNDPLVNVFGNRGFDPNADAFFAGDTDTENADEYQRVSIAESPLQLDSPMESEQSNSELARSQAEQSEMVRNAGSAVLTTVIASGAMSAVGKGSALGVLGVNTTTNNYVYLASNGKRMAVRTFEALISKVPAAGSKLTAKSLVCEQVRSSGIVSGAELGSQTLVAALASSIPLWCAFDPLVILDRYATEYAPHDAAEEAGLATIVKTN